MCLTPSDYKSLVILKSLLYSKNKTIQILAASRLSKMFIYGIKNKIVDIFIQGHTNKNHDLRALCIMILWSHSFSRHYISRHYGVYRKAYPLLLRAMKASSEIVQIASFFSLKKLHDYNLNDKKALKVIRTIYKNSKSPFIRYHSIIALSKLFDRDIVNNTAMDANAPMAERLAAIIGFTDMKSGKKTGLRLDYGLDKFLKILQKEKNIAMKGFLFYAIATSFKNVDIGRSGKMFSSLFFGLFKNNIIELLHSENHFLKYVTLFSFFNYQYIPKDLLHLIRKMAKKSQDYHFKAYVRGIWLFSMNDNKNKLQHKIHNWTKKTKNRNDKISQVYRAAIVKGYYKNIMQGVKKYKNLKAFYLGPMISSYSQQKEFQNDRLILFKGNDKKARKQYIKDLENILDIYFSTKKMDKKEQKAFLYYAYRLVSFYQMDKTYKNALKLIEKAFKITGWIDDKLIAKWSILKDVLGRRKEAIKKLQYFISKKHFRFSPVLLRALAKLYQKENKNKKALDILYEQYKYYPYDPEALVAIGHFFCDRKDYIKAIPFFLEYTLHFPPINAKDQIGMARTHAASGRTELAIDILNKLCKEQYITKQDLDYPEFKAILSEVENLKYIYMSAFERKAFKKIMKKKKYRKFRNLFEKMQNLGK